MDGRRRRWVPIDVDLFSADGRAVYERFGHAGLTTWIGFLTACQKASTPGRMRWRTENEALVLMGMAGYDLVDNLGKAFTIAEFFRWTGQRGWTATVRQRHGDGAATTSARRWSDWQPRRHRPAPPPANPKPKPLRRGAPKAPKGPDKGAEGAPEGLGPDLTSPSLSSVGEEREERSPARATAGPSAPRPADPHAAEPTAQPEPNPASNGVPAESTAALDAFLGRDRPDGPEPPSRDEQLVALREGYPEQFAKAVATPAQLAAELRHGPVDLPAPEPEPSEEQALPPVVPASFHDELERVKGAGQVAEGGGP